MRRDLTMKGVEPRFLYKQITEGHLRDTTEPLRVQKKRTNNEPKSAATEFKTQTGHPTLTHDSEWIYVYSNTCIACLYMVPACFVSSSASAVEKQPLGRVVNEYHSARVVSLSHAPARLGARPWSRWRPPTR